MNLHNYCLTGTTSALFDMDGTLFDGDLGECTFALLLIAEYLNCKPCQLNIADVRAIDSAGSVRAIPMLQQYIAYIHAKKYPAAYQLATDYIATYPYDTILKTCAHAFTEFLDPTLALTVDSSALAVFVYPKPQMLSYIRACKKPVLVSASPRCVVSAFAELNNLGAIKIIAAEEKIERLPYGENKVELAKQTGIDRPFIAFGNSEGDIEMLRWAKLGVLRTTTSTPEVIKIGQNEGWLLLD